MKSDNIRFSELKKLLASDGLKGDANYPTNINAAYTLLEGYKQIGAPQERRSHTQDIAAEHLAFAQPGRELRGIRCFFCEGPHFLSDCEKCTEKERNDIYKKNDKSRPHGWVNTSAPAAAASPSAPSRSNKPAKTREGTINSSVQDADDSSDEPFDRSQTTFKEYQDFINW